VGGTGDEQFKTITDLEGGAADTSRIVDPSHRTLCKCRNDRNNANNQSAHGISSQVARGTVPMQCLSN
jgi:hypothetical protein